MLLNLKLKLFQNRKKIMQIVKIQSARKGEGGGEENLRNQSLRGQEGQKGGGEKRIKWVEIILMTLQKKRISLILDIKNVILGKCQKHTEGFPKFISPIGYGVFDQQLVMGGGALGANWDFIYSWNHF